MSSVDRNQPLTRPARIANARSRAIICLGRGFLTEILRGENEKAKAAALVPHRGIGVLEWAGLCFHQHSRFVRWFSLDLRVAEKAAIGAERSGISRIVTACRSLGTDLTRSVVGQALPLSLPLSAD